MKVTYKDAPMENSMFSVSADEVAGSATFKAYIDGNLIWQHECPDPPCHEQIRIPPKIAGSTFLLEVADSREQQELTFFINDDGRGLAQPPRVKEFQIA